jgi:hypothetical protein
MTQPPTQEQFELLERHAASLTDKSSAYRQTCSDLRKIDDRDDLLGSEDVGVSVEQLARMAAEFEATVPALRAVLAYARLGAATAKKLRDGEAEGFIVSGCGIAIDLADEAERLGLLPPAQEAERRSGGSNP